MSTHNNIDKIVQEHAGLVKMIAFQILKKCPGNVRLEDIMQSGMIGLIEAANRYQADKGAKFETYATIRVRGAMIDELRRAGWLPRHTYVNLRKIHAAQEKLGHANGRQPRAKEMADVLGISLNEYRLLIEQVNQGQLSSFDEDITNYQSDHQLCTYEHAEQLDIKNKINALLNDLPKREQLVIRQYYHQNMSLKDIGDLMDVSESRVSQLKNGAVERLKTSLHQKNSWHSLKE